MKRLFVLLLAVSCLLAPIHAFAQTKTAVTLATIGNDTISSTAFQTHFTYERYVMSAQIKQIFDLYKSYSFTSDQIAQQLSSQTPYSTWISELQIPELLGQHVIDDMIDDQLIKQEASHMNIVVNDVDVDHELKRFFGVTGDLDHLSADDQTKYEADLKQYLSDLKQATGLTEVDIRPYYEAKAFRDAITDSLTKGVSQVLYAHLRHILVATEADAKDILKQLHAGKDFAALAKQYSTDTTTSENGGELDWTMVDNYVAEFADAVRQAHEGDIVGPVKTQFGYHIIDILGLENRVGTDTDISTIKTNAFNKWLNTLRASAESDINLIPTWMDYIPNLPAYTLPVDPATDTPPTATPLPPATAETLDLNSIKFDEIYEHPSKKFSVAVPTGWLVGQTINHENGLEVTFNNPTALSVIQVSAQPFEPAQKFEEMDAYYSPSELEYSWSNYNDYKEIQRHREDDKLIIDFDMKDTGDQPYKARQISWLKHGWLIGIRIVVPAAQPKLLDYLADNLITSLKFDGK